MNSWIGRLAVALAALMLAGQDAQAAAARARHHARRSAPVRTYVRPAAAPAAAPAPPPEAGCGRQCLAGHLDKVLQAMMDHAPAGAGLAPNARYTENGRALPLGEGLWRTASAIAMQGDGLSSLGANSPAYRLYFADVADGQAGYLGSVTESGRPAVMMLRVKVVGGQTAQVEAIVVRQSDPAPVTLQPRAFTTPDPALLAADGSQARSALVAAVNRYFEAMRGQAGAAPTLSPACVRRENGRAFGCAPQPVSAVRDGRVMLADVDRGLVLVEAMLDRRFTGAAASTELAAMLFKLKGGQVARIEGLSVPVALGAGGGWTP